MSTRQCVNGTVLVTPAGKGCTTKRGNRPVKPEWDHVINKINQYQHDICLLKQRIEQLENLTVSFIATILSSPQIIPISVPTKIVNWSYIGSSNEFNITYLSSGTITIPSDGTYFITSQINWAADALVPVYSQHRRSIIYINGGATQHPSSVVPLETSETTVVNTISLELQAGDTVDVYAEQDSTSPLAITVNGSSFYVQKLHK